MTGTRTYLLQLHCTKDANIAAEVSVVAMPSHMLAEIDLGGSVGAANGAAHPSLRRRAFRVCPQVSLKRLLDRARVRTERTSVLLPLVSAKWGKREIELIARFLSQRNVERSSYGSSCTKSFEYLYLTRCKANERFFPVGVIPWATCAATWVSISHLLLVVKSQPVDGHLLASPVSVPDRVGWQSAMCFLRAGLVGATTSQEPQE